MNTFLHDQYKACCNAYADLLIKTFESSWTDSYWIADNVGGILDINGEYTFDMKDIVYAIDNDMTYEDITSWYDYNLNADYLGIFSINIRQWNEGTPHVSEADIELLKELRSEVTEAEHTVGADSPTYSNAKRKYDIAYDRIMKSIGILSSEI